MADMATFRPFELLPIRLIPRDLAEAQGLSLLMAELPPLIDPSSAADRPEDARTESSAASSIRRRIDVTERNTPGSIGGGVAFPGLGLGNGGGGGNEEKELCGESGGV